MLQQSPKFGGRNSYWIWFQSNGPSFAPSDGTFCRRRPSPRPLIASHSCALGRTAGCRTPPAAAAEPPRAPHTMTAVDLRCPARRLERLRERARRPHLGQSVGAAPSPPDLAPEPPRMAPGPVLNSPRPLPLLRAAAARQPRVWTLEENERARPYK
jgi:hypothetical protein